MPAAKTSLSMTQELAQALDRLAADRGEDRSRLVETLLRENPLVQRAVLRLRGPMVRFETRKGRPVDELFALGRAARTRWERQLASGRLRILGGQ